ncbi:MAG: hypothetical protein AABZ02_02865 [Bacteroidota bacterium]
MNEWFASLNREETIGKSSSGGPVRTAWPGGHGGIFRHRWIYTWGGPARLRSGSRCSGSPPDYVVRAGRKAGLVRLRLRTPTPARPQQAGGGCPIPQTFRGHGGTRTPMPARPPQAGGGFPIPQNSRG